MASPKLNDKIKTYKQTDKAMPSDDKISEATDTENFSHHIYQVLNKVQPFVSISNKSMYIVNLLVNDVFERIASEASKLAIQGKQSTISAYHVEAAVGVILSGELAKHAMSDGNRALNKYRNAE